MSGRRDRGVSTALGYVLTLGITALLISGLLIAVTGVVDDRRTQTDRATMEVVGQRIAANLMSADRLAETDPEELVVVVDLPARLTQRGYTVEVDGSAGQIALRVDGGQASATVSFANSTAVQDGTVRGGDLQIVLTPADELEVQRA